MKTLKCLRCGHKWHPRSDNRPQLCPACKSRAWDKKRTRNIKHKIKSKTKGTVLFELQCLSLKECVEAAVQSGVDLTEADLAKADLAGANLVGAELPRANLYRADLTGADLTRANMAGAILTRADMTGADLYRADLYGADMSRAELFRADLTGANMACVIMTKT